MGSVIRNLPSRPGGYFSLAEILLLNEFRIDLRVLLGGIVFEI